jgi:hypothetical protein
MKVDMRVDVYVHEEIEVEMDGKEVLSKQQQVAVADC